MTTAQKSPISASDSLNRFILWANSKTESIRNLAFPGAMALIVSFRIISPLRHTKLCKIQNVSLSKWNNRKKILTLCHINVGNRHCLHFKEGNAMYSCVPNKRAARLI